MLTRAATDLYSAKDYPRAMAAAETLLARQPPVEVAKQRIAWTVIANADFEQGMFDKAEAGYSSAQALILDTHAEGADDAETGNDDTSHITLPLLRIREGDRCLTRRCCVPSDSRSHP